MVKVALIELRATFNNLTGVWDSTSKDFALLLNSTIPFGGFTGADGTAPEVALVLARKAISELKVVRHTKPKKEQGSAQTIY